MTSRAHVRHVRECTSVRGLPLGAELIIIIHLYFLLLVTLLICLFQCLLNKLINL